MLRGVLRAALSVGLMLALWTFARPAAAMPAGFCDDRGATSIAPPPALEAPDEAIERTRAPVTCFGDALEGRVAISPAHAGIASFGSDAGSALTARAVTIAAPPAPCADASSFFAVEASPPYGVRVRVERPPRG